MTPRRLPSYRHLRRPRQLRRRARTPHRDRGRRRALCRNIHVKDFAFSRRDGWVGFTLAGCPLGEGLLDYQHLVTTTRARERGLSQIIEHWLPWQGDSASTIRTENEWNLHNLTYLRSQAA